MRIEGAIVNTMVLTTPCSLPVGQPIEPDGNTDIDGDVDFEEVISGQPQYGLATSANYTVSGLPLGW